MTISKEEEVFAELLDAASEAPIGSHGHGQGTVERIMRDRRLGGPTIRRGLFKLKAQDRVHIYAWTNASPRAPVWVRGPGEDAPKPPNKSKEERRAVALAREIQRKAMAATGLGERDGVLKEQTMQCIEWVRKNPQSWIGPLLPWNTALTREAA